MVRGPSLNSLFEDEEASVSGELEVAAELESGEVGGRAPDEPQTGVTIKGLERLESCVARACEIIPQRLEEREEAVEKVKELSAWVERLRQENKRLKVDHKNHQKLKADLSAFKRRHEKLRARADLMLARFELTETK